MTERSPRTAADLGEVALVARILEGLATDASGLEVGPGDDAAVLDVDGGRLTWTVDSQIEEVHFRRDWIDPEHLGRRAIAINASDLAAMGARPRASLCALMLTGEVELPWIDRLVDGLRRGGEACGCPVIGGDVARVPDRMAITLTAAGRLEPGVEPLRRSGAVDGDGCWITGAPGRSGAGLSLLREGFRLQPRADGPDAVTDRFGAAPAVPEGLTVDDLRRCLARHVVPRPPLALGPVCAAKGLVHAAIDVSDGVAIDLMRICMASDVGVLLDGDALVGDPLLRRLEGAGIGEAVDWALGGGEDYELLCALPPSSEEPFLAVVEDLDLEARKIGRFTAASRGRRVRIDGGIEPLESRGWDHFA